VAFLEAQDLSFGYGSRPVLNAASFGVEKGEFVALIGPNGSGKSTLIRLLTRLLTPESGEMLIGGKSIQKLGPRVLASCIAVVPQESVIDFDFTAFEVVLMGRAPHLRPLVQESRHDLDVAHEAMRMTDTTHLADRSIQKISGGERQRVIVARALAQETEALLLDEPTSHLDINHQVELLTLVHRLCREKQMAVLAVLHDLNLASTYADRILILYQGRIAADGPPEAVITQERILEVFGAHVRIIPHPETGRPITLLPGAEGVDEGRRAMKG